MTPGWHRRPRVHPGGEGLPYGLSLSPGRTAHCLSPSPVLKDIKYGPAALPGRIGCGWRPIRSIFTLARAGRRMGNGSFTRTAIFKRTLDTIGLTSAWVRQTVLEHRVLTQGQAQWFAATYGDPSESCGGGSNMPAWTRNGQILFSRKLPESRVAWEYQAQRPDTDHFNREFKMESARGGTEICRLNAARWDGDTTDAERPGCVGLSRSPSQATVSRWSFVARLPAGVPSIGSWIKTGATNAASLEAWTTGGADHPRWLGPAKVRQRESRRVWPETVLQRSRRSPWPDARH